MGGTDSDLLQHARRKRHAVIYTRIPTGATHGNSVTLNDVKPYDLEKALEGCGYSNERARVLSQKCNGKIQVLKRILCDLSPSPDWASSAEISEIKIASLIGEWNGNFEGDKEVIEQLSGKAYGEWIGMILPITLKPDPPLTQKNDKWRFISRFEGWECFGPHLTNAELDSFKNLAIKVLKEKDPKFALPKTERFSDTIKQGIAETLALLGSHPDALTSCSKGKPDSIAAVIVREVFNDADWVIWASLTNVIPLLAEAAPDVFLKVIENRLNNSNAQVFIDLFAQEGSSVLGGWNYITGILWALETLAWNQDYISRAAVILAELAVIDPGGNWANRPINSLISIFLPWFPQTVASVSHRKNAVRAILQECPEIGWKLLLSLLPQMYQTSSESRKPSWREYIPADRSGKVARTEYSEQVLVYTNLIVNEVFKDLKKLPEIINHFGELPPQAQTEIFKHLRSDISSNLGEEEKVVIWESLLDVVTKHRKFATAKWALPIDIVNSLSELTDNFKPSSPALIYRRLFCQAEHELMEDNRDYQQQRIELEEKRMLAIEKILENCGMKGIFSFYETVTNVRMVGVAFGKVATPEHDINVLPQFLGSNDDKKQLFISGYVISRFNKDGWQWADNVAKTAWSEDVIIKFLTLLPFVPETWQRAEKLLGDKEKSYWHKADPRTLREENFLSDAIEKLLKYGRPIAAIACLSRMLHVKKIIPIDQAFQALIYDPNSTEVIKEPLDHYSCTEIIKWLQSNAGQENERLFLVEWRYLPLLDRHYGLIPLTLEKYLVERPDFFCQVIQLVFHSKNEETSIAESSEEKKRLAENAYDLLYKWRKIPGSDTKGAIDGKVLKSWVKEVKKRCEESGHLQIALDQIGKVLAHAPEDPEGLWIHNTVANVLNEKDHDAMRAAFTCELLNERGVHGWTAGTEEMALAEEYRKKAEMVDHAGYFRLAGALRGLAESYERYGKMEEDDPLER